MFKVWSFNTYSFCCLRRYALKEMGDNWVNHTQLLFNELQRLGKSDVKELFGGRPLRIADLTFHLIVRVRQTEHH